MLTVSVRRLHDTGKSGPSPKAAGHPVGEPSKSFQMHATDFIMLSGEAELVGIGQEQGHDRFGDG
ncbi:hypothetical protein ACIBQ1_05290 [Nonomuraea sp. NPDC050153]|uniref:hypothetical protein n=1 Tax=Nonomuraea sp. NPDC050153 TaxID=3364359 RepID=UPI0037962EFF